MTSIDLVSEKGKIKCNNIINDPKNVNFDDVTKENIKENNPNWPEVLDHPYRILIVEVLDLEKQMHYLI